MKTKRKRLCGENILLRFGCICVVGTSICGIVYFASVEVFFFLANQMRGDAESRST